MKEYYIKKLTIPGVTMSLAETTPSNLFPQEPRTLMWAIRGKLKGSGSVPIFYLENPTIENLEEIKSCLEESIVALKGIK